jgi:predicted nucleic acid-binding protein
VTAVFADTFYWTALTNADDEAHQQAVEFSRSLRPERTVTTEDVLDEYLAYFSAARPSIRTRAGDTVAALLENSRVVIVPQSHELFLAGLELYRTRPDKGYSLTDCISMQIMHREGLTEVLTNDRHFEQEGFRALFRA